jgi:uncharacterized DUF497 family protein
VFIAELRWSEWNEEHIARHGVDPTEVEEVVFHRPFHATRASDNRFLLVGQTDSGRYLSVIVETEPDGLFFVVTARDAAPYERRLYRRHHPG